MLSAFVVFSLAFIWVTPFYSMLRKSFSTYFPKHTILYESVALKLKVYVNFAHFQLQKSC